MSRAERHLGVVKLFGPASARRTYYPPRAERHYCAWRVFKSASARQTYSQLYPYVLNLLVNFHQLVAHLHREAECEVGFLHGGEHLGRVHIAP